MQILQYSSVRMNTVDSWLTVKIGSTGASGGMMELALFTIRKIYITTLVSKGLAYTNYTVYRRKKKWILTYVVTHVNRSGAIFAEFHDSDHVGKKSSPRILHRSGQKVRKNNLTYVHNKIILFICWHKQADCKTKQYIVILLFGFTATSLHKYALLKISLSRILYTDIQNSSDVEYL